MDKLSTNNGDLVSLIDRQIAALEKQIQELERDKADAMRLYGKYGQQTQLPMMGLPDSTPYRNATLRDAIISILEKHGGPVAVKQIAKEILSGGYETKARSLDAPIFAVLSRLAKNGEVEKKEAGVYRLKKNDETG